MPSPYIAGPEKGKLYKISVQKHEQFCNEYEKYRILQDVGKSKSDKTKIPQFSIFLFICDPHVEMSLETQVLGMGNI